jgi:hypothetical protein
MEFNVTRSDTPGELGSGHRYRIWRGGRLVAIYWHDSRGDDHGIEFVDGRKDHCPVGMMTDFLKGGGPKPVRLSEEAVAYLARMNP